MNSRKEIDAYLCAHYAHTPTCELARRLNMSAKTVYHHAHALGLRKDLETIRETSRMMYLSNSRFRLTQFKKGNIPFNKGKKQEEYASPDAITRSSRTRFHKGHIPRNHLPVGSERVSKNGYIEVKVAEPNIWAFRHCEEWRRHYGDVPSGHIVIFRDGNPRNYSIDNLALMSRRDNMRRNSIYNYPEDLKKAIRGIATIKSIITKKQKKHEKQSNT